MYYLSTKSEGPIVRGRGEKRALLHYPSYAQAGRECKEYSIKHACICEVFHGDKMNGVNVEKDKKVIAYKKGELIYFNIR